MAIYQFFIPSTYTRANPNLDWLKYNQRCGMQDNQLTTNQNELGFRIAMSALGIVVF